MDLYGLVNLPPGEGNAPAWLWIPIFLLILGFILYQRRKQ
jgi:hypothetical protein